MAKKEKTVVPEIVDSVEALEAKMKAMREAQKVFATFTQEQVDKIFYEAAMAANKQRIPLAKMAVEETQRGIVEDKVIKNHYAAEYIYNAYKNTKTCGVIEEDTAYGIKKVAEPIGLVAAVIPTTNPTSTAIFKTLICLKTRNAIIISPHPAAKECTIAAAKVVLEAAVKAGAPEGIIGWIDVPSLELTNEVMKSADIILATGGPGMVKAAYSSGKPALGVGAGNTPVIIDDTADVRMAVNSIIHSKTFDNGMICASEQSIICDEDMAEAVQAEKTEKKEAVNILDLLLGSDVGEIKLPTKEVEITRLSQVYGAPFILTIKAITPAKFEEIQDMSIDVKGKDADIDITQLQLFTVIEGVVDATGAPMFKNKELMSKFKVSTPKDLVRAILLSGEIAKILSLIHI